MHKIAKRAFVPVLALVFILGTMSAAFAASSSGSGMPEGLAAQIDQGSIAAALQLPEGSQREQEATVAVVVTPPTTVAGQQTTPTAVAGVTSLPSTATDNATSIALLAAGLAALAAGMILRSRLAR